MKKMMVLILLIMVLSCKTQSKEEMKEVSKIPLVRVSVVDNFEVIYQKQGFVVVDTLSTETSKNYFVFNEYTDKGVFKTKIQKSQWSTIIIEEVQSDNDETIILDRCDPTEIMKAMNVN